MFLRALLILVSIAFTSLQTGAQTAGRQVTHEELAASRQQLIQQIDKELDPTGARKGLQAGDVLTVVGDVVVALGRGGLLVLQGAFDLARLIVSAVGSVVSAAIDVVKNVAHAGRQADPLLRPGSADGGIQVARVGVSTRVATGGAHEGLPADYDWRIPGGAAPPSAPPRTSTEAVVRWHADAKVHEEIERLNQQCGRPAASLAGSNDTIVMACLSEIRKVREGCARTGRSLRACQSVAAAADDDCEVEDTTEFFRELAGTCHATMMARR